MKALLIIPSHSEESETGNRTGFDFEELARLYYALQDHGVAATLCTVTGKTPVPAAGTCNREDNRRNGSSVRRFINDIEAMYKLENIYALQDHHYNYYDCIVFIGGPGAVWEFPHTKAIADLNRNYMLTQRPIAAIGLGNVALLSNQKLKNLKICMPKIDGKILPRSIKDRLTDVICSNTMSVSYHNGCPLISATDAHEALPLAKTILQHARTSLDEVI